MDNYILEFLTLEFILCTTRLRVSKIHVKREVNGALEGAPTPSSCPSDRLFDPDHLHSRVLQVCYSTCLSCHLGVARTLLAVSQRFWWPSLVKDVKEFLAACPTFAQSKRSRRSLSSLLCLLPIPRRSWLHISVESGGITAILTVVDRFSKMVHFIALPKLAAAKETAELLVNQIFRLHSLPCNIVSDRWPQFATMFWAEFCRLLGACHLASILKSVDRLNAYTRR